MRNRIQFIGLRTKRITTKDKLENVVTEALKNNNVELDEGDILAITSKIVSVCEKRVVKIEASKPGKKPAQRSASEVFEKLVDQESDYRFPGDMFLTVKDGIFIPAAGIDRSNIQEGYAVLWPKNPQKSAENLLKTFKKQTKIGSLGVMIIDSHIQPLRDGVTSFCLTCSGFEGVEDVRGHKDLYGKPLRITKRAIADSLAATCSVMMGEADESIPIVLIREAAVTFSEREMRPDELKRKSKDCLYKQLYPKGLFKSK